MLKLVLVVHGENDPRVLIIESEVMVESIRSGSTYVDYFYLY
ncbi:MAG: dipeptidyl aminopeptidase/acylaminoacyl peptidase [Cognaticolwellia sp.]|jgi:dipeptidyl aminopeptidase/acylaminoacyl peptidase